MVFLSYLWSEAKFSDMDKVQKQRGSIVLHKETRDGADYIRIEYANSQAVALLLAQDTGMEMPCTLLHGLSRHNIAACLSGLSRNKT